MRYYEPAGVEAVLDRMMAEPSLSGGVVHHALIPARRADFVPMPDWLDPRLRSGLATRGVERLYRHQAEAIDAVRKGEDVVVVTPTASGKSLCYLVPTLQALAHDPTARALYLFPTKALGQDQVAELGELSRAAGLDINASTYDGDTPNPIRSAIRSAGQVVVTNPDMLHAAILPHHTKWFQLFEQLQIIVIDELHTYRGLFGSHIANVLRRLLRVCAHYGSHPVIVCCSATIGNPAELAATAALVAGRLGLASHDFAFQSAGRTGEPWLGPDILAEIRRLAGEGVRELVIRPVGFVADHLEVLYDIDIEAQVVAREVGVHIERARSLNTDPVFIAGLADVAEAALATPASGTAPAPRATTADPATAAAPGAAPTPIA